MNLRRLKKQINKRKNLINTLLIYLRPTNRIMVYLSQDLDKHIAKYQKLLFIRQNRTNISFSLNEKLAA